MLPRLSLIVLLWSPFVALAQPAAPGTPGRVGRPLAERSPLLVGASTDSVPYAYVEPDGKWSGFTVELLDAVARTMNLRIERVPATGRDLQQRFRDGEFDFMQLLSQSPERERYADFSVPVLNLQGAIFVQQRGSSIRTLADFNGKKFAIIGVGSIGEQFLRDRGINVEAVYVNSTSEGLRRVETGECAGVFASHLTVLSLIEKGGAHNLVQFGPPLADYDIRHCFAVHKGDAQLLARLNEGLAILHYSGEFDRIYAKWFGRFGSPLISRETVVRYVTVALAVAFAAALWGLIHQRRLRHRIAAQSAELAGQQALLRALYDNLPLAIGVFEAEPAGHRVLTINRQAEVFFGAPAAQAAGRVLRELPLEADWAAQLEGLLTRGHGAPAIVREERALGAAHRRFIFTLVPMAPGPTGQPRFCVLVEDITERRHLDEEIAQSRRLRAVGELVGGIAHEFNNLLTPVMLQVGLIQTDWSHDSRLIAETRLIAEVAQRAAELTRRLLTFGRKSEAEIVPVRLSAAISSCFALLRLTVDRRIVWEQAVPPELPPLQFNATDLNQIILNLVINARDTLLEKLVLHPGEWTPTIRLEARALPADALKWPEGAPARRPVLGWQQLTVRDNGAGMTPEVRERIFEPFYTTKPVGKGSGLGLATVWHLVTEVGGRIEVESVPGEGSAFHVYLPVLAAEKAAAPADAHAAHREPGRARVFLAEDDQLVATAVTAALRRDGHELTHLPDGAAAWQHLQQHAGGYDVLVLDVNMPGLDGIELAMRVRTSGSFTGRMMVISGRLGSDDLRQISKAGIDRVLNKPFDVAELLGAVRECLRTGRRT